MLKKIPLLLLFVFLAPEAWAGPLQKGARIYVAPMEGDLNTYITGEIIRQKLPLTVVTTEEAAEYTLSGTMSSKEDQWHNTAKEVALIAMGVPSMMDKNQASVTLIDKARQAVIWAANVGDRRFLLQLHARKGHGKLAKKIVSKMKKMIGK